MPMTRLALPAPELPRFSLAPRLSVMHDLDLIPFADNPDPRAPCLLLLDTSASMSGEPIRALNEGLRTFHADLMNDELARRRVEVALVTFGPGGVKTVQDFVTVDEWQPPSLSAGGSTPLGGALLSGLAILQERKRLYQRAGASYYRPWVFLITDGEPTDRWQEATQQLHAEEAGRGLVFFAVGVERANFKTLAQIATPGRPPLKLKGLEFAELFLWLSRSQQRVSHSRVGDQLALPPIGWAEVGT